MRRNRRKLAAQLLDQQLCQAVDETLTKANYPPLPRPCPFPTPQDPVTSLPQAVHLPSVTPELPLLPDFAKFDIAAFSRFAISSTTPPPLKTPSPFRTLPKWCPRIPSLTLGDVWRDSLPTFHDLSSLPEPAAASNTTPKATRKPCQDLQVWRPVGTGYGRDQSRFFPSRDQSTSDGTDNQRGKGVTVKLPPSVACRLHRSDSAAASSSPSPVPESRISQAILAAFAEFKCVTPLSIHSSEQTQSSVLTSTCCESASSELNLPTLPGPADDKANFTTAATPEDDLKTSQTSVAASTTMNSCPSMIVQTTSEVQQRQNLATPCLLRYNDEQPPYELDGREIEIPYVHANSLIGYSNDPSVPDILPEHEERQSLADSGVDIHIIISSESDDMVGLNELAVDHDIMAPVSGISAAGVALPISLPATPPATPPLIPLSDMATILPTDCVTEAEYIHSDAHYCSEQALFSSPLTLAQSAEMLHENINSSSINITDFLKLGHAKQCWCGHCTDEPSDPARSGADASLSSSTTLADRDRAADEYGELTLSLLLHPSESEPDTESDDPELLDVNQADVDCTTCQQATVETVEDDEWLLYSPAAFKPAEKQISSAFTMYTPSSPILHRQRQHKDPVLTVAITSSEPSVNEPLGDYIAVAAPTPAATSLTITSVEWRDTFPRNSSSVWKADLTTRESERFGFGFAPARRGSWRWGRESEEEWWDWAVEEEC